MSEIMCQDCPVGKYIETLADEEDKITGLHVAGGLAAAISESLQGTLGLTEVRIEQIREEETTEWEKSGGNTEVEFLNKYPEIAKASYKCEHKISVLGSCAMYPIVSSNENR